MVIFSLRQIIIIFQVTSFVVETLDNSLDANNEEFKNAMISNAPTRILQSLDTQIANLQKRGDNFTHMGRNINVMAFNVYQGTLSDGLGYALVNGQGNGEMDIMGVNNGSSGQIFYNISAIPILDTDASITLPELDLNYLGKINTHQHIYI